MEGMAGTRTAGSGLARRASRVACLIASLAATAACEGTDAGRAAGEDASVAGTDTGTAGDVDAGNDTGSSCEEIGFPIAGEPPDMLVLLDRSLSMSWGTPTSWSMVTTALSQVTAGMDAQIRFGLMFFPAGAVECAPPGSVPDVPVDILNATAIASGLLAGTADGGGTPTTAALSAAAAYLASLADGYAKYILLATDGAPNCSSDLSLTCSACVGTQTGGACYDPSDCLDADLAMSTAQQIHDKKHMDVYVIGVGGAVGAWNDVMSGIAYYGGTNDYYPASTPADLEAALTEIAASSVSCTFDVDWDALGPGVSKSKNLVNLLADGEVAPYDADCSGAGWRWLDGDTIELCPDLCAGYKDGSVSVIAATFGCATEVG
jgi:hypothetical protein